jgi:acetylornithine deacetylase/succinyl-diaminopimelate desuccinylase-like protein
MRNPDDPLSRLVEFCRIPSVSTSHKSLSLATEWLLETYGSQADWSDIFHTEDGFPVGLLLHFQGDDSRRITFYNYYDVTPPGDKSTWLSPPFAGQIRQGRLYARGAASNKGDLIARLEAVSRLKSVGALRRDVVCWLDAQEEIGAPNIAPMLDRWEKRLACRTLVWNTGFISDDGVPIVCCGYKGVLIVALAASTAGVSGHSGIGLGASAIHNLIHDIHPLLGDRGLDQFDTISRSRSTDFSRNVQLALETGLFDNLINEAMSGVYGARYKGSDPSALIRRALFEATANLPWLRAGSADELTRYADSAQCVLELRLIPPQRARSLSAELSDYCRAREVTCTVLMEMDPYMAEVAGREDALALLTPALKHAFRHPPRILPIAPFSAPATKVAERLGATVVGVGLTESRSSPHASNESISCALFNSNVEFVTRLLETL